MAEVKRLEGWMTFPEAAAVLHITVPGVHHLCFDRAHPVIDLDNDVRTVGANGLKLIRTSAVEAEKQRRVATGELVDRGKAAA